MFKRRPHSQNYYSNRGSELRSRRAFNNKLHIIKDLIIKLCIFLLFISAIYIILFSPVFAVKNVVIEGNKAINGSDMDEMIKSFAGQKKWKIFNNNLFLINSFDIETLIKSRFGNIDAVKVEKKFPQTVKIIIKEKSADISWCNKITIEKVTNEKNISGEAATPFEIPQCYLSDENGYVYEKIGDSSAGNSVKVFRDEPIAIGIKISDENLKNFIRSISHDFNAKTGLNLSYLYILPPASRELHLVTLENWKIFFDLNRGADEQIDVLNAFIKNELKANDKKNIDYEYIDLRVVDRVFIKPKNEDKNGI